MLYSGSLPFEGYVFLAETSLKRLDAGGIRGLRFTVGSLKFSGGRD